MTDRIELLPYGRHSVGEDDVAAVAAALRSGSLTGGPLVERFEAAFAAATGAAEAVACANGTVALHMAVRAAGIGPGDAVIVPTLTFLATASAPHLAGAEVVFADVDPDTGLLRPADLEAALAHAGRLRVKAVLPVHLNGRTVDMAGIATLAERHGLVVIEDACHALGTVTATADGGRETVGACRSSAMACFSFHPVKTIAMGEGGAVTTNDPALAARLRLARNHGMTRDPAAFTEHDQARAADGSANPWYYEMHAPSLNLRESEIHCALGLSQLAKLDRFVARRRRLAALYDAALAPLAPVVRPVPPVPWCEPVLHLYAVLVDLERAGLDRAALMQRLRARGVGTQVHYLPVHRQPFWRARSGNLRLPGADAYYRRCLSLPLFPDMADDDVARVVAALAGSLA